jgi:hypothetical protein
MTALASTDKNTHTHTRTHAQGLKEEEEEEKEEEGEKRKTKKKKKRGSHLRLRLPPLPASTNAPHCRHALCTLARRTRRATEARRPAELCFSAHARAFSPEPRPHVRNALAT